MVINKHVKYDIKLTRELTFAPPKNQAPFFFNSPQKKTLFQHLGRGAENAQRCELERHRESY